MLPPKKDPKGFYKTLGISSSANEDEVKSAYRNQAKKLHPDTNHGYDAGQKFLRLSTAYKTLTNKEERTAYDLSAQTGEEFTTKEFREKYCTACKCSGENLRYIIFYELIKTPKGIKKHAIQGVFCDKCAKKIAIRSSFRTWLLAFHGGIKGLKDAFGILVYNLKGGVKPSRLNFKLLFGRARWHLNNDRKRKAAFCVYHSALYAKTPAHKEAVSAMAEELKGVRFPKAKKEWKKFNQATFVQLAPLWFLMIMLFYTAYANGLFSINLQNQRLNFNPNEQENIRVIDLPNNPSDENFIYYVSSKELIIYQGPGVTFSMVGMLKNLETIRITGLLPGTPWVKIITRDGLVGFVPSQYLTKGPGTDAIETLSSPGSDVRSLFPRH
jgi:curved DNA-binding protein CbpA